MNLLAIVLTCSVHTDDMLVRAIVDNAHGNAILVVAPNLDLSAGEAGRIPETREAATALLKDLLAHNENPLVGLLQVPASWAIEAGRAPEDLFDPCINVSIGSSRIADFDYQCAKPARGPLAPGWRSPGATSNRRACTLNRYAAALRLVDLPRVVLLNLQQPPKDDVSSAAPIFRREPATWGANCLFVQPASPPPATTPGTPSEPVAIPPSGWEPPRAGVYDR